MNLETRRLILRELTQEDFPRLYEILSNEETMRHYPAPYDKAGVERWLRWNKENYNAFGFGLYAVVLKDTGEMIGDCGVTMQRIHGWIKPEIGYHIHKAYWRKGYASEAAAAWRDYIFSNTPFNCLYSYMTSSNLASSATAVRCGMVYRETYEEDGESTKVYAITRAQWEQMKNGKDGHEVVSGGVRDIDSWMDLVARVRETFPGLEAQALMDEHRATVLRFMGEGRALCVKEEGRVIGVLLFSVKRSMICCMAVDPAYRRRGVGSALLRAALARLDRTRDISVSTFCEEDPRGEAPRALYQRMGFEPRELHVEFDAPEQRFVLPGEEARV